MSNICVFNLPSSAVHVSFLHDRREIKGHSSPKPVPQVGGCLNVLLAIYDVVLLYDRNKKTIIYETSKRVHFRKRKRSSREEDTTVKPRRRAKELIKYVRYISDEILLYRGSFPHISLGPGKSFVIPRTPSYRGWLNRDSTVLHSGKKGPIL